MGHQFGLIGYPLSHSFSKKYFETKFLNEGLKGHSYDLFEIDRVEKFKDLFNSHPTLLGLNVTIPYKQTILPFLDGLDSSAELVGAVNVIHKRDSRLIGFNSDFYGFQKSLLSWLPTTRNFSALVLGDGGAAKAVKAVLKSIGVSYQTVSRRESDENISYEELNESRLLEKHLLLINTTPVGMAPTIDQCPNIPYSQINNSHFIYDLIYNPKETKFLQKGRLYGAQTKNGFEMLELQAERSWEIWTS